MDVAGSSATAALSLIAKPVTALFSTIFKIAKEIREVAKQVKANKHQCSRLSERITILVGFLQGKQVSETLSGSIKEALISFINFLQKCLEFINKFTSAGFFDRLWNNKDYFLQFTEFHTELTQYTTDFTFGMNLADKLDNKNQNQGIENKSPSITPALSTMTPENIFESGIWIYRRCVNEKWQDACKCALIFDPDREKMTGSGEDNLGHFELDGTFDPKIKAIEMVWSYKDHLQIIQLQWDESRNILRGISLEKKEITDETCRCMGEFEIALFTPF